jgi:hypothetical protein
VTMVVRHSPGSRRLTLGADKAYDVHEFVDDLRDLNVTPHIAQNTTNRSSAIDARTTHHPGYAISQQKRKRTEEPFGWAKMIGGFARPMLRGAARLRFKFTFTMAAYDLIRLPKLLGADERHVAHNGIHTCRARHRHRPAVLAIATHGPANTNFSNLLAGHQFWTREVRRRPPLPIHPAVFTKGRGVAEKPRHARKKGKGNDC